MKKVRNTKNGCNSPPMMNGRVNYVELLSTKPSRMAIAMLKLKGHERVY